MKKYRVMLFSHPSDGDVLFCALVEAKLWYYIGLGITVQA